MNRIATICIAGLLFSCALAYVGIAVQPDFSEQSVNDILFKRSERGVQFNDGIGVEIPAFLGDGLNGSTK